MKVEAGAGVTELAARIPSSGIREIFNLAAGRPGMLHLEVGEPDFATPAHVVEAAFAAARAGSGYTATTGLPAVREAAAAHLKSIHALDVDPGDLFITHGATQAIATAFAACVGPSDQVLIPDPAWPNYEMLALAKGAKPVRYPVRATDGFLPDPDVVRGLVTQRTKLLVINSPSNPTGGVLSRQLLEELVSIARSAGAFVISDEVYDEIVFDGLKPLSALDLDRDRVIGTWSCSKTYAMTGWRVGYMTAPAALRPAITAIQESEIACVSSVSQAAAMAALSGPQTCVSEMRDAYQARRDVLVDLLDKAGIDTVKPGGAFYLMLPLSGGADGRRAALDLVDLGVAVAPGTAFGNVGASALRISLAAGADTISRAAEIIVDWYGRTDGGLANS